MCAFWWINFCCCCCCFSPRFLSIFSFMVNCFEEIVTAGTKPRWKKKNTPAHSTPAISCLEYSKVIVNQNQENMSDGKSIGNIFFSFRKITFWWLWILILSIADCFQFWKNLRASKTSIHICHYTPLQTASSVSGVNIVYLDVLSDRPRVIFSIHLVIFILFFENHF